MELISRAQAIEAGKPLYFTGKPCPKHHVSTRRVINRGCSACFKEEQDRRYAEKLSKNETYMTQARSRAKRWAQENPDKYKENQHNWRTNNPERVKKIIATWIKENPEKYATMRKTHDIRRKDRIRGNGGTATVEEVEQLRARQKGRCAGCKKKCKKMDLDHILPLARGGTGHISNLQFLCPHCNGSKSAQDPFLWAQRNGRLL